MSPFCYFRGHGSLAICENCGQRVPLPPHLRPEDIRAVCAKSASQERASFDSFACIHLGECVGETKPANPRGCPGIRDRDRTQVFACAIFGCCAPLRCGSVEAHVHWCHRCDQYQRANSNAEGAESAERAGKSPSGAAGAASK